MDAKIRVYGKSQSRTALGIINAYLKLFPDSTLSDLRKAFPESLNPKSFTDNIIVPVEEAKGHEKQFFEKEDELIVLKNGKKLALVEVWSKNDFDAICEHAKQYGIEVAGLEGTKPFEKGSFELEYLNDFVPPGNIASLISENEGKDKRKYAWWWLLLLILLLLILFFCWKKCSCGENCPMPKSASPECVTPPGIPSSAAAPDSIKGVSDSLANNLFSDAGDAILLALPDGKSLKIAKDGPEFKLFDFINSEDAKVDVSDNTKGWITLDKLSFASGKAIIPPAAENQLKSIAAIMKAYPSTHIKMGGYSDKTGSEAVNMRLSSERAKIAAEKLISLGVEADRVTHEGYGSQYPVCPANDTDACKAANRRIDVKVTGK